MSKQHTPKTLIEAIVNGIEDLKPSVPEPQLEERIELHVRDFLAQKFSVAILQTEDPALLKKLWKDITGKEIK